MTLIRPQFLATHFSHDLTDLHYFFQKSMCVCCLDPRVVIIRPEYHQISVVIMVFVILYRGATSLVLVTRDTLEHGVKMVCQGIEGGLLESVK